jgi:superfamily I DNA/RNA helicase
MAGLGFSDFAILYRTDRQSSHIIEALTQAGMPFQKRSHDRLLNRPGVAQVTKDMAFVNGETVLDRLRSAAMEDPAAHELLKPLARECGNDLERFYTELALGVEVDTLDPRADRISLLTLHAAKGLEFPVVFIVGCEDGLLPLRWPGSSEAEGSAELAEERRLLFVGMTRAQRQLFLSYGSTRPRSPFLRELTDAHAVGGSNKGKRKAIQLSLL